MFHPRDAAVRGLLPDLRIARIAPGGPSDPWVYATVGAWELTAAAGHGVEFVLLAAGADESHADTLGRVVQRHAGTAIDVGHTVALGRGWCAGSPCDHVLACPPYPYNVSLERCEAGLPIRVLWVVPVTASEAALARRDGAEALERRLQDAGVDFLAPHRSPVA